MDKKTALLYAQLNSYKYLLNKTESFIKHTLSIVKTPYVACSFGKDSSVMLHLVLKYAPTVEVRFVRWKNETDLLGNYDDVIKRWGDINLTQVELHRSSVEDKVAERFDTKGYDSYFIGFRQEESVARRITLKKLGDFYQMKNGMYRISPLSKWKTTDIAAYILSNELPTLDTYEKFGFSERTASRVPRENFGIRSHSLSLLKQRDISAFNQLLNNYPELSNYV